MIAIHMPYYCIFLMLAFASSCKKHVHTEPQHSDIQKQIQTLKAFKQDFIIVPGKVCLIHFPYFGPFKSESLVCNNQKISFSVHNHEATAYVAPSYFAEDSLACDFHFGDSDDATHHFSIGSFHLQFYDYPHESLNADKNKVVLSPEDQERVDREKQMLTKIFENSEKSPLFTGAFSSPLSSKITSIYGTKRIFNKGTQTEHLGTDYRAKIGTPIFASNSGKVVFAGDLFLGGKTVVVDHGLGIFTSYSHLSQIKTKIDQRVTKKSLLGLSGMTGRVNGPHLHWGVKVHGNWVDGHSLIAASQQNFLRISSNSIELPNKST